MAQIAAILHWSKAELDALTLPELIAWHERAVRVWNQLWGDGKST